MCVMTHTLCISQMTNMPVAFKVDRLYEQHLSVHLNSVKRVDTVTEQMWGHIC